MQQSSSKARIEYVDLAKGVCILLVVLDHISDFGYFASGDYPLSDIFEQTRMPLYFVLSGLFFKDYAGGIGEFMLRKTNRILVPYLFFMLVYRAFVKVVHTTTGISLGSVWSPLWFLLCLFWMNCIFATAYYLTGRFIRSSLMREVVLAGCMLVLSIVGYFVGHLPLNIDTALTCMPFLWMGYMLNRRLHLLQRRIPWPLALCLGLVLLVVLHFTYMGDNYFYLNTYSAPLPFVLLGGLMGTLGVLLLSSVVKWVPVISYIGRYSIIVLCTHLLVVKGVMAMFSLLPFCKEQFGLVPSLIVLAMTVVCSVFLCWLLSNYLPWFTAQKDLIKLKSTTSSSKC